MFGEVNNGKKKVAFPWVNRYNIGVKYFVEHALDAQYILQPPMTRRTLEMGEKNSPDFVCTPFKTTLGSMIDALEAGADTLIMTFGLCKLGYFGELQEQILRDMGYRFDFVNMAQYSTGGLKGYLDAFRQVNSRLKFGRMVKAGLASMRMADCLDDMEDRYYQNCGFEAEKGAYRRVWNQFLQAMTLAENKKDIEKGYRRGVEGFGAIPLNKPEQPLRVGLVGEYFTVMDAFSNLDLEQKLADMGVEVHRWMNVSHRNLHYDGSNLEVQARDYVKYEMSATATANVWYAKKCGEKGYDGLIHVKSASCTPEMDLMPVLANIGADYKMPVLFLTFDSQTSDTGLSTRLEAFFDMIQMRKQVLR